ncbi:MAG: ASKHA domain-containing protein [Thiohalomonadaceae bacterium]
MPTLVVRVRGAEHRLSFVPGQSVRSLLDATDFRVRSACHGIGACGLCRIRVLGGDAGEPTANERYHLAAGELQQGIRLACQVKPLGDLVIAVLNTAPASRWKSPPFSLLREHGAVPDGTLRPVPVAVSTPLGVAVDIGTTNISLALWNLRDGVPMAERRALNPQAGFGADVVSRLLAADASRDSAAALSRCLVEAIRDGLWDISAREGFELRQVVRITLVANTAMLALLTDCGHGHLLQPAHWAEHIACTPTDVASWIEQWGVHSEAQVEVVQPLAGFVGSDLLAGLLATRLIEGDAPALFVDVGTNSEIALWNGQAMWVTAAAGGPAFESGGVSHGMPAETGAVYRVHLDADHDTLRYEVIGESAGKGICGSGLVDLLAALRRSGRLTARGHLRDGGQPVTRFAFSAGGPDLALTNHDVDALHRAKAAVATGIQVLCLRAGIAPQDLARVCVAGAFGRDLDVANAQSIGLLPAARGARYELVGNTALSGCSDLLLHTEAAERLARIETAARLVNLGQSPEFDDLFLAGLYLEPFATSP